jgi:ABC-type thiamine transport system ATPase subunit
LIKQFNALYFFLLDLDEKQVLRNVSGEFHARELSAIMGELYSYQKIIIIFYSMVGPSGSGKSSLLDILSGYNTSRNIKGAIKINGILCDQKQFRHMSSYIMQDHFLHPLLTVQEAMKFSVNLKIGKEMSNEEKTKRVRHA